MNLKIFHLLAFILVHLSSVKLVYSSEASVIQVSVFYETRCSDFMSFIENQLLPLFKKLGDYFIIQFIPFGKSQMEYHASDGLWYFTCQHGNEECYYNMLHACALNKIENRFTRTGYIACLMTTKKEDLILKACSVMFKVGLDDIKHCIYDPEDGNKLLAGYGNKTFHYFPNGLSFVPTVIINGVYREDDESMALKNFEELICKYINTSYNVSTPKDCKKYSD